MSDDDRLQDVLETNLELSREIDNMSKWETKVQETVKRLRDRVKAMMDTPTWPDEQDITDWLSEIDEELTEIDLDVMQARAEAAAEDRRDT